MTLKQLFNIIEGTIYENDKVQITIDRTNDEFAGFSKTIQVNDIITSHLKNYKLTRISKEKGCWNVSIGKVETVETELPTVKEFIDILGACFGIPFTSGYVYFSKSDIKEQELKLKEYFIDEESWKKVLDLKISKIHKFYAESNWFDLHIKLAD